MVKLQCSISAQDCATLFTPSTTLHKLPYASGSCVRDNRLTGNVGRCGFPGAACVTDALGNDNCAYGGDSTVANYKPLCQNGFCGGGLGAKCSNGDYDCNWGYYCNTTAASGIVGVCGGYNAFVDSQGDIGVDFAFDYCLSGKATQSATGSWYCTAETATTVTTGSSSVPIGGVTTSVSTRGSTTTLEQTVTVVGSVTRTVPIVQSSLSFSRSPDNSGIPVGPTGTKSKHHSNTGLIAGVVAAVVVVLILLIIIFFLWRRSRDNKRPAPSSQINQTSPFANGYTTEPLLAPPSNGMPPSPSPPMQQMTGSTTTPSFANTGNYSAQAPVFTYLPEIQADPNAGGRDSYPNNNVPGGYSSSVLPTTPSSPAFAYGSAVGPSPATSPSPYAPSFVSTGGSNNAQYIPVDAGNRDATERHLLAARMEAEKELAQMRWDGRDVR